jgi:hypothetical protein
MNRDATTEKVVKSIEKCGHEGIRLAVFPETIIPGRIFSDWVLIAQNAMFSWT